MTKKKFDLEKNLERLNELVQILDDGEESLDKMLEYYKEAMDLSEKCREYLEDTRQKIIEIGKNDQID